LHHGIEILCASATIGAALVRVGTVVFQVAYRYKYNNGVAALRCCRRVYTGWHVDIETRLVGYEVLLEDAVE